MDGTKARKMVGDLRWLPRIEVAPAAAVDEEGPKIVRIESRNAGPLGVVPPRPVPDLVPLGWAWFAGLVGPAVAAVCIAVEPAPTDPDAQVPPLGGLLFVALLATWALAAMAAVRRAPQALTWAAVGGGLSLAMTLACPASGHHAGIGTWWATQLVVSGGGLVIAATARTRRGHR